MGTMGWAGVGREDLRSFPTWVILGFILTSSSQNSTSQKKGKKMLSE